MKTKTKEVKPLHTLEGKEFESAFYGRHGMTPQDAAKRMVAINLEPELKDNVKQSINTPTDPTREPNAG